LILGTCGSLIEIEESKENAANDKIVSLESPKTAYHQGHPDRGSNLDADNTNSIPLIPVPNVTTCPTEL
jgi:hypothetical protein